MGAKEMLFEIFASAFGHQVDRDAGSVGTDEGSGFAKLFYFFKQLLFDVQSFNYHFNDPIAGSNIFQVVGKVSCGYFLCSFFGINGRGVAFKSLLQGLIHKAVTL